MLPRLRFWCEHCAASHEAPYGTRPSACPSCGAVDHWTRTPPFRITANDRRYILKPFVILDDTPL